MTASKREKTRKVVLLINPQARSAQRCAEAALTLFAAPPWALQVRFTRDWEDIGH